MVEIEDNVIRITQGDTLETFVDIFLESGELYEPSEGDRVRFALKSDKKSSEVLLNVDIPIDTMCLLVPAELTKTIPYRNKPYMYDVELTYGSGHVYTFICEAEYYSLPEVV